MGGCLSDVKGGAATDAFDFFPRSHNYDLFTQIELTLSASKLLDRQITSKSNPMVVVYIKKNEALQEIGRSEVVLKSLNPQWIEKIAVAFHFATVQTLVFRVYDIDTKYYDVPVKKIKLNDQDFLGEASCILSEICTKRGRSLTRCLEDGHGGSRNIGSLTIRADQTPIASRSVMQLRFQCFHLGHKEYFSKSDPFLKIYRVVETGSPIPLCKTEVVKGRRDPLWGFVDLSMEKIGSKDNPLIIECFRYNRNGNHKLIGKVEKSIDDLEELSKGRNGARFTIPSSSCGGHDKVLKLQLSVHSFYEKAHYSFLDYICNGFKLKFMVAVDFGGSNGDPRDPKSLHYIDHTGRLNSYQQAVMEVWEVMQFYDGHDRRFPAWGFGARLPNGIISHCFNLSLNQTQTEVQGLEGIMEAYANTLQNVTLGGPTLLAQVINKAAEFILEGRYLCTQGYIVMLIITDGVPTDLQQTVDAALNYAKLPLSVLIVGVGKADFKQMEILNADKGKRLESSKGRVAPRNIVKFVSMQEVHGGQISLVEALLETFPEQYLSYMRSGPIITPTLLPSTSMHTS